MVVRGRVDDLMLGLFRRLGMQIPVYRRVVTFYLKLTSRRTGTGKKAAWSWGLEVTDGDGTERARQLESNHAGASAGIESFKPRGRISWNRIL